MAVPWMGSKSSLGIDKEGTWGTDPGAPRTTWRHLVSWSVERTRARALTPLLYQGASHDAREEYVQQDETAGDFEVLAGYTGLGLLLEAATGGTVVETGAGPYVHTFNMGATLPSLTLAAVRGTSGEQDKVVGAKIARWSLSSAAKDIGRFKATVLAQSLTRSTGTGAETPGTPSTNYILPAHSGTLSFNSANYTMASWELSGDNKLSRVDELGALTTMEPVIDGVREIRFKASLVWRSDTLHVAHISDTESDLVLILAGSGTDAMTITARNARIWRKSDPITAFGMLRQEVEWLAKADAVDTSLTVAITDSNALYSAS